MTPQEQNIAQAGPLNTKICGSRLCENFRIPQPLDNFAKNISKKDGLQTLCRKCLSRVKKSRRKDFPRIPDDQMKICSRCQLPKLALEFYSNRSRPDGVGACCKICAAISTASSIGKNKSHYSSKSREWKSNNPEKTRATERKKRKNRWTTKAIWSCRDRAKKKGVHFDITKEDLLDANTNKLPEFCPIFPHINLDYGGGSDRRRWASVDRIVPELGYISGNVWVVSTAANMWKTNGSNEAERRIIVEIMTGSRTGKRKYVIRNDEQGLLFLL